MDTATALLLLLRRGGLAYLLRDEFTTAAAAGFTSPASGEPGPGKLVRSLDSLSQVSKDTGDLVFSGTAPVNYADPAYYYTDNAGGSFARAAGETVIFKLVSTGVMNIGFTTNTTIANGTLFGALTNSAGTLSYTRGGTTVAIGAFAAATTYLIAVTLRANGLEIRIKGGVYSEWALVFVETNWNTTPLWPAHASAGAVVTRFPFVRMPLMADVGRLTASEVLSVSSPDTTIRAGKAETFICLTGTPPTGGAGNLLELRYRQLDANNYMLARIQWNGANYELVTGHVIAGVETLQGSPIASVAFAANVERLIVRATVNAHDFWTTPSTTITKRYGTITDATGAAELGVSVRNVGFTATSLLAWDYLDADIAANLDRLSV